MGLDSDHPQEEPRLTEDRLSVFDKRVIGRNDEDGLAIFLEELVAQHTVVPAPE